jgi:aminopeptidase YwaD
VKATAHTRSSRKVRDEAFRVIHWLGWPVVVVAMATAGVGAQLQRPDGVPLPASLARRIDPVIAAVWLAFDTRTALADVRFISQYWRLPGNAGFDASIDHVRSRLEAAGLRTTVEQYAGNGHAWDYSVGTLAIVRSGRPDEVVLSREKERLALCINSFSTPAGGAVARLVDVGRGDREDDYAGKDVNGAVILGDAAASQLWRQGVAGHGAIGVISTSLPDYLNQDPPGGQVTPRDQWDILQWSSISYDDTRQGFGFKASPRAAATLRQALAAGPVSVRATIASTFSEAPVQTLVVEIPGRTHPDERVVMAAHVQEPGANDNASGVATLAGMAAALSSAIQRGKIAAPDRTLTFLFVNEISGSTQWLQAHAAVVSGVRYMFSMDMTGEDVKKTGGSFLIERFPDPGAVWDRPWDPHTEWGRGNVRADQLHGDLINDLHRAVCDRVARRSGWVVNTNPYEGGSDHTVFGNAGVPAVLDWHFTDRYYHTNLDTPDKTSADEMRNVGVSVAATAWLMASATSADAIAVAELVSNAGRSRVALEAREGAALAAADAEPAAARSRETDIVAAWKKWYGEAVRSAARLVVGAPAPGFDARLGALAAPFEPQGDPATAFMTCGTDAILDSPIALTWEAVALAADGRLYSPCPGGIDLAAHPVDHRERRERTVIDQASTSRDAGIRRQAAMADGPLGRWNEAARLLDDPDPRVRRQAASALADVLSGVAGEPASSLPPAISAADVDRARARLESQVVLERSDDVAAVMLESLGRLKYGDEGGRTSVEALLVKNAQGAPLRVLGAVKGLEAFVRLNPRRPPSDAARARLREIVAAPVAPASAPDLAVTLDRTRRLAFTALMTARDTDASTLLVGARDPDWQVRRMAAQRMDASRADLAGVVQALLKDPAFEVRYEMVAVVARDVLRTNDCTQIAALMQDQEPTVVLRAVDQMPRPCATSPEIRAWLTARASELRGDADWHVPARALAALVRVAPGEGRPLLAAAQVHRAWQVRATSATSAGVVADVAALVALASDPDPNVRTAAIEALVRAKRPEAVPAAIAALASDDVQLVRTAAGALSGTAGDARNGAVDALLASVRRFTATGADTTRDARTAIVERIGELLPAERARELNPYVTDFDPKVRAAAAKAVTALTGRADVPTSTVRHRYPYQPPVEALSSLPAGATLVMEGGDRVEIAFFPDDAPVTVARFVELARSGYYDGLTFHRIVPNFVVQGGSPHANEYSSDVARFMRDEVGTAPHLRGSVGMSTRGRDTGDGQIFIDLLDLPRLDHDYTVFGQVTAGMDLVDRFLEGARIARVIVK